jgi:hypothetical protein
MKKITALLLIGVFFLGAASVFATPQKRAAAAKVFARDASLKANNMPGRKCIPSSFNTCL